MLKLCDSEPFHVEYKFVVLYILYGVGIQTAVSIFCVAKTYRPDGVAKCVVSESALCTYFDEFTLANDARMCVNICTPLFTCNSHSRAST